MPHPDPLQRLAELDTNTVSDALDVLQLPGAVVGIRPLWDCPTVVGRDSTVKLAPRTDAAPGVHLISPVIDAITGGDRVLVIAGGIDGVSCWGDIIANAAVAKSIRGAVIDGFSRDIDGSASIGFPVYGRGVTMVSARHRVVQVGAGVTISVGGVDVSENDFVIADRCGSVIIPVAVIEQVLDLSERIAAREAGMVEAVRSGRSVADVMHDSQFDAIRVEPAQ